MSTVTINPQTLAQHLLIAADAYMAMATNARNHMPPGSGWAQVAQQFDKQVGECRQLAAALQSANGFYGEQATGALAITYDEEV